jgi:hypothetical protein
LSINNEPINQQQKENKNMYESPVLVDLGDAQDIILGIAHWGDDMDGHIIVRGFEFVDQIDPACLA